MSQFIDIGRGAVNVQVEIADGVSVTCLGPQHATVDRAESFGSVGDAQDLPLDQVVVDRVCESLIHPHRFLPIADMVVPGDHLAIALEAGLPQIESIAAGVLRAVKDCELGKLEVVVSDATDELSLSRLRRWLPETVELTIHRFGERGSQRYLAADEDAEPIRLNRSLVDADLVLPISVMRVTDPIVGGPSTDAIFPALADEGQLKRLQRSTIRAIERQEQYHHDWAAGQSEQVRWALGVQLMVAIEITTGGAIGEIIASSPETLRELVRDHFVASRGGGQPESADVVVVCIEGDATQQTIENLARAALVGRSHASTSGSIVLVTGLSALGRPGEPDDLFDEETLTVADQTREAEARYDHQADERAAEQAEPEVSVTSQASFARKVVRELINEIDSSRRYLLWSACEPEVAEAFGFGVISDSAALVRLINQHDQCCLIRAAQTAPDAGVLDAV